MILPDYNRLKEMYEDQTVAISQLTKERDDAKAAERADKMVTAVIDSQKDFEAIRTRAETAEACCAEMRDLIRIAWEDCATTDSTKNLHYEVSANAMLDLYQRSMGDDCGKPILDRVKRLEEALAAYKHVIQLAWEDRRDDSDVEYIGKLAEARCNDDFGVGWLSPEGVMRLRGTLELLVNYLRYAGHTGQHSISACEACKRVKAGEQALAETEAAQ
jgi:hypothetical protein